MYSYQESKKKQREAAEKECRKSGKPLGEWPEDRGESSALPHYLKANDKEGEKIACKYCHGCGGYYGGCGGGYSQKGKN